MNIILLTTLTYMCIHVLEYVVYQVLEYVADKLLMHPNLHCK